MDRADFLPPRIRDLPERDGPFDAFRLAAGGADFDQDTAEIEFWFSASTERTA